MRAYLLLAALATVALAFPTAAAEACWVTPDENVSECEDTPNGIRCPLPLVSVRVDCYGPVEIHKQIGR